MQSSILTKGCPHDIFYLRFENHSHICIIKNISKIEEICNMYSYVHIKV